MPARRARRAARSLAISLSLCALASSAHARDGESLEEVKGIKPDEAKPDEAKPGEAKPEAPKGPWDLGVYGFVRMGYENVQRDERYDFVGRNSGFLLDGARVGVQGRNREYGLTFRVSAEGAADQISSPNTPLGTLDVRLRDAFGRFDPVPWFGIQAGQFKAPFQDAELRGAQNLMFATRAVGVEGVRVGRGIQQSGIALARQLGVMLSPDKPIGAGGFGFAYYAMLMNGNGANQLLDDNGRLGIVGRIEGNYEKYARVGVALFRNDRTVGAPPNLYFEEDLGLTGDVDVQIAGLEVFGSVTRLRTVFPTVGVSERIQLAFQGQAAYRFDLPARIQLSPGYRYAHFHPWEKGGEDGFDTFQVDYHTFGVKVGHATLPLLAWLNYTVTVEREPRQLDNNRLQLIGQLTF